MKTLLEYNEELKEIGEATITHFNRFKSLTVKHTDTVCELVDFGVHIPFMSLEERQKFFDLTSSLLNSMEELGETVEDIGRDMDRLGTHGKEFCEAVIEELRK